MKKLWIIAFSAFLLGTMPAIAEMQLSPAIEVEMDGITLNFQDNKVQITNAEGKILEVYNLTGVRVARIQIEDNDMQINLNLNRGCYIIKVGKLVRKVTVL